MKAKLYCIVLFAAICMILLAGCSSQETKKTESIETNESAVHYLYYGESFYSDDYVDISLSKIQLDGVFLNVKNKTNKDYGFSVKALALDGRNQGQYNMIEHTSPESYTLAASESSEVIYYCQIQTLNHKTISVVFQLTGTDGKVIEMKEAKADNLKESASSYREIRDVEVLHHSNNLVISYGDIKNAGLYFNVQNNTDAFVKISYDCKLDSDKNGSKDKAFSETWIPSKCIGDIVACDEFELKDATSGHFSLTMYKQDTDEIIEEVSISFADMKTKYDLLGSNDSQYMGN